MRTKKRPGRMTGGGGRVQERPAMCGAWDVYCMSWSQVPDVNIHQLLMPVVVSIVNKELHDSQETVTRS